MTSRSLRRTLSVAPFFKAPAPPEILHGPLKSRRTKFFVPAIALLAGVSILTAAPSAQAATKYWEPTGTASTNANGTWATSGSVWNTNSTGTGTLTTFNNSAVTGTYSSGTVSGTYTYTVGDDAVFSDDPAITALSTVTTTGLAANSLTFGNAGVTNGGAASGFTFTNGGTLVIGSYAATGANTYTGNTAITLNAGAGPVTFSGQVNLANSIPDAAGGSTLNYSIANNSSSALTFNGTFVGGTRPNNTSDTVNLTLSGTGGVTFNGVITGNTVGGSNIPSLASVGGNVNLIINGGGAVALNAANSAIGSVALSNGSLTLGNSLAMQGLALNQTGGTFSFGTLTAATIAGLNGSSTLTLTNSGGAGVALSDVGISGTTSGTAVSPTFSGGINGLGSLTLNGVQKAGSGTGGTATFSGVLGFTGAGGLTINDVVPTGTSSGASSVVLTNANTYTGPTNVTLPGGSLTLNGNGSITGTSAITLNSGVVAGSTTAGTTTLVYDNTSNGTANRLGTAPLTLNGSTLNYKAVTTGTSVAGTGSAGAITIGTGQTSTFTFAAATGTGNTSNFTIASLSQGTHGTLSSYLPGANQTTDLITLTTAPTLINGILPWTYESSNGNFLSVNASNQLNAYGSGGTGPDATAFNNTATSNVLLTAASATPSAAVAENSLIVNFNGTQALGGQTLTLTSGGLVFKTATGVLGSAANDGSLTTSSTSPELFVNTAANGTINAAITNSGSTSVALTKFGTGTLTLAGTDTYTGVTTVEQGGLTIASTGSVAGSTATLNGGTTFTNSGVAGALTNSVGATATLNGGSTTGAITDNGTLTIAGSTAVTTGNISGTGATGTISYTNTYAGNGTTTTGNTLTLAAGTNSFSTLTNSSTVGTLTIGASSTAATTLTTFTGNAGTTTVFKGATGSVINIGNNLNTSATENVSLSGGTVNLLGSGNFGANLTINGATVGTGTSGQNFNNVANFTMSSGTFTDTAQYGFRAGNSSGSGSGASNAFTGTQTGGTFTINTGDGLNIGGNSGSYVSSYSLSGGTLYVQQGNLNIGANASGTGSTTFTLGGTGTLLVANSIVGNQGSSAVQNFVFNGGTLSAYTVDMTKLTTSGATTGTASTLTNAGGTLAPGGVGTTGKTAITGNYTVSSSSGSLAIDLGGTTASSVFQDAVNSGKFDLVAVTGTATLGGTLSVNLINGTGGTTFVPASGNTFTVLTAGSISGTFTNSTVSPTNDPFSGRLTITVGTTSVILGGYVSNEWQGGSPNAWGSGGTAEWTYGVDPNSAGAGAKFGAAGAANNNVTLDQNRTVGQMIFSTANYTLTSSGGAVLTLDNGASPAAITLQDAHAQIINAPVTLNSDLALTGFSGASLTLSGTLSGGTHNITTSTAGTLVLSGTDTYNNLTIGSGSTVQLGAGGTSGNLGSGTVTDNGTLAFNRSDTVTVPTAITGAGVLTQMGSGTIVLSLANSYTGATTVSSGVLNIQNATALGTTATGTSVSAGAALQIQGGITVGAEALTLNGTGISNDGALRNISGTNVYQGAVTLGSATRVNSDSGSLTFNTAAPSFTGGYNLTLGGAGNGTVSGVIATTTGTLTKDGAGTWTLGAANTYTGATTVSAGILSADVASAFYTSSSLTVNPGATLRSLATGANLGGGAVALNEGTIQVGNGSIAAASATLPGVLTYNGGSFINLNDTGSSTAALAFNGATNSLARGSGASLIINGTTALNGTTDTLTFANYTTTGASNPGVITNGILPTYEVGTVGASTNADFLTTVSGTTFANSPIKAYSAYTTFPTSNGTNTGVYSAASNTAITASEAAFGLKVNSGVTISGSAGVTLNIGGGNTSQGGIILNGSGDLVSVPNLSAGSGELDFYTGGTATVSSSVTSQSGGPFVTFFGPGTLTLAGTSWIDTNASGVISFNGGNVIANLGNTFSADPVDVNNGTLTAGLGSLFNGAGGSSMTIAALATFDLHGLNETVSSLNGAGIVNDTTGSATLFVGSGNGTFSGVLKNTGGTLGLTKDGTGTFNLTGLNTYAGSTLANGGTINFAPVAGGSQSSGQVSFGGDGAVASTFAGSGSALTFSSLSARSTGASGAFDLVGGTNGTTNKIVLTGQSTGFIDQGTFFGTSAASGSNYAWYDSTGFVRGINYGVDAGSATAAGGVSLTGTYVQTTGAVTAQATAAFTTLNISGANNFTLATGATLTTNGILKSGSGASTLSGGSGIQAASNAELVVNTDVSGDSLTIGTPILANGANALTKTGAGTVTLTAPNTYTGPTAIDNGTLQVGAAGNLGSTSAVALYPGATLSFNTSSALSYSGVSVTGLGANGVYTGSTVLNGLDFAGFPNSGALIQAGAGALTLNNVTNVASITRNVSTGALTLGSVTGIGTVTDSSTTGYTSVTSGVVVTNTLVSPTTFNQSGSGLTVNSVAGASGSALVFGSSDGTGSTTILGQAQVNGQLLKLTGGTVTLNNGAAVNDNLEVSGGTLTVGTAGSRISFGGTNQTLVIDGGTLLVPNLTYGFRANGVQAGANQSGGSGYLFLASQSSGNLSVLSGNADTSLSLGSTSTGNSYTYNLSGGTASVLGTGTNGYLDLGADTGGSSTATFNLSGGKLLVSSTIEGAQAFTAAQSPTVSGLSTGAKTFTVSSATGLVVGETIQTGSAGTFPAGTTISAISGTTVTASNNPTTTTGGTATFFSSPVQSFVWTGGTLTTPNYVATNLTSTANTAVSASTNTLTNNGGTLAPGFISPVTANGNVVTGTQYTGMTTITGNYAVPSASAAYAVNLGGTTASNGFATTAADYDTTNVTLTAALGGKLNIGLINSFTPTSANTFTILQTGTGTKSVNSLTGTFTNSEIGKAATPNRFVVGSAGLNSINATYTAGTASAVGSVILGSYAAGNTYTGASGVAWDAAAAADWSVFDPGSTSAPATVASGAIAQFADGTGTGTGADIVTLNSTRNIQGIQFSSAVAGHNYTVNDAGSNNSLIILDNTANGAAATIADSSASGNVNAINVPITLNSNLAVSVTNMGTVLTIGGPIGQSAAGSTFTETGAGTVILTGANTYTGATTISPTGLLQLGNGGSTGSLSTSSAIVDNSNLTIDRGNAVVQGTDFNAAPITGSGSLKDIGAGTLTLNSANTYSGTTTITGGGTLSTTLLANGGVASGIGSSPNGAASLILSNGTLQYVGSAATSTDRLFAVGSTSALAGVSGALDASGAGALSFTNTGSVSYGTTNITSTLVLQGSNTGANTFAPIIGDNGTGQVSLTKAGVGTWLVTGANTYSGGTTVSDGTLTGSSGSFGSGFVTVNPTGATGNMADNATLNSTGSIGVTAAVTVNSEASDSGYGVGTINFNDATPTIGSLTGSGNVVLNNPTSTALTTGNSTSTTFSGVISESTAGEGSLTVQGAGMFTLTGVNTYTGATTINAGTLNVARAGTPGNASGGTLGATAITVNNGGTLLVSASDALGTNSSVALAGGSTFRTAGASQGAAVSTMAGAISSTATMSTVGLGALTLNGNSTLDYNSTTATLVFSSLTVNSGTLDVTNYTNNTASSSGNVNSGIDGTDDRLVFMQDLNTGNLLGDINFNGTPAAEISLDNGFFEIVPTAVPEPATWLAGALFVGALGYHLRRRAVGAWRRLAA